MSKTVRMRGISASPGIAIGPARVVDREKIKIPRMRITGADAKDEIDRLMEAVTESRTQLEAARDMLSKSSNGGLSSSNRLSHDDHSLILEAHLMMLRDDSFIRGATDLIAGDLINAEWALARKMNEIKDMLANLGDAYFQERAQDVDFVGVRILRNLLGHVTAIVDESGIPCVVFADNLSPAETSQMVGATVLGFCTEAGTRTSHTAIMAQALGIPAVVGVENVSERVNAGDTVIIDGNDGVVIIRPDVKTVDDYRVRAQHHAELEKKLLSTRDEPAVTRDGVRFSLYSNIEFPAEAAMALDYGAEGIGLYRTEFLYLDRPSFPDEEEQFRVYRTVVEAMAPRPVVFRTFDLGADKVSSNVSQHEINPALGLRAIRLGLKNRSMFKTQLRALLRAAAFGDLRIMFPMISGVGELRQVKSLLAEARRELGAEAPEQVRVGCMIELPSAVFVADRLAEEVDFFSIGTNDLIQYSLAIDRGNDHVAYLYTPFHPAVLRAVWMTVKAGRAAGIGVSMCGGMASEPLLTPLLVGMGIETLSMAPTSIPTIKAMIRTISQAEAQKVTREALDLATAVEIEDLIRRHVGDKLNFDV